MTVLTHDAFPCEGPAIRLDPRIAAALERVRQILEAYPPPNGIGRLKKLPALGEPPEWLPDPELEAHMAEARREDERDREEIERAELERQAALDAIAAAAAASAVAPADPDVDAPLEHTTPARAPRPPPNTAVPARAAEGGSANVENLTTVTQMVTAASAPPEAAAHEPDSPSAAKPNPFTGRRMAPADHALMLVAARHLHGATRCVFLVENGDELPALDVPAELGRRQARCVICGRLAQADDDLLWNTRGVRA